MTPLQYLKLFCDNNILEHIAHHTNLYSVQQSGKSIKTNAKEIEVFFGIQITMAIVKTSQYKMHWSPEFQYESVVMAMTLKQYETLRKFLDVNVNDSRNNPKNPNDKLFKVRPLLDLMRNNWINTKKFISGVRIWDRARLFYYGGKHSAGAGRCGAEESVHPLVEEIPKNQNYRVFFDNWF